MMRESKGFRDRPNARPTFEGASTQMDDDHEFIPGPPSVTRHLQVLGALSHLILLNRLTGTQGQLLRTPQYGFRPF